MATKPAKDRKTLIGILSSKDDDKANESLVDLLNSMVKTKREILDRYRFVFTGGTYDRIVLGHGDTKDWSGKAVTKSTRQWLMPRSIRLPKAIDGGVTILANMVVERQCSIVWPFYSPLTGHWLTPDNLALMRLCDHWHVKRLMNSGSVREWLDREAETDATRNLQSWPPSIVFADRKVKAVAATQFQDTQFQETGIALVRPEPSARPRSLAEQTIALIAHDEMKSRIVEFAVDYEPQLRQFKRILATGTTARQVRDATRDLEKLIMPCQSGPKGGDIEIATEILFGKCHVVTFFVDTQHPHPHIEDIRVVFGACMINDQVRMLTNEMQAREWMDRVVKQGAA